MIQEIITYAIVVFAVALTIQKTVKKFKKKKSVPSDENLKAETSNTQHKCSDCIAECVLRDSVSPALKTEDALCKKMDSTSD
jgi:large-conductance mechanosensitive channel